MPFNAVPLFEPARNKTTQSQGLFYAEDAWTLSLGLEKVTDVVRYGANQKTRIIH